MCWAVYLLGVELVVHSGQVQVKQKAGTTIPKFKFFCPRGANCRLDQIEVRPQKAT